MSDYVEAPGDIIKSPFSLKKISNSMSSKLKRVESLAESGGLSKLNEEQKDTLLYFYMKQNAELIAECARLSRGALLSNERRGND